MKPEKVDIATVTYLIKNNWICLAPKKQNIHTSDGVHFPQSKLILNGYGGKMEVGDFSILHTAKRELFDESGVIVETRDLIPTGEISFYWPKNISNTPDMIVHFFFVSQYQHEPKETAEMGKPIFFHFAKIPFDRMMQADKIFLPKMLNGEKVKAEIFFNKKDIAGNPMVIYKTN